MDENKKPIGRPVSIKPENQMSKGYMVSLTPDERNAIIKKYGSLSVALKGLIK